MHPNMAPKKGPINEIHAPNINNINATLGENKNSNNPNMNQIIFYFPLSIYTFRKVQILQRLLLSTR